MKALQTSFQLNILLLAALLLGLSVFSISITQNVYKNIGLELIEKNNQELAVKIMDKIELLLYHYIRNVSDLRFLPHLEEITDVTVSGDNTSWQTSDELYLELRENELSQYIIEYYMGRSIDNLGYPVFSEVFLTNEEGIVIGLTGKTIKLDHRNEAWWKQAVETGACMSDIILDESTNTNGLSVALSLNGESGELVAVIKAHIDVSRVIEEARIGLNLNSLTNIKLLTNDGLLLYSSELFKFNDDLSKEQFFIESTAHDFYIDNDFLYTFAASQGIRNYINPRWKLVLISDLRQIFKPIDDLNRWYLIVLLGYLSIALGLSFLIIRSIMKPLKEFEKGAVAIANGNLDYNFKVSSTKELIKLAEVFNTMTGELKVLYTNLERSNKDLEQFAYLSSHDLQEPLRKMSSYATLLSEEKGDLLDDEGRRYTEVIRQSASHMSELVRNILEYSKLASLDMPSELVSLSKVFDSVLDNLELQIKKSQAEISIFQINYSIPGNYEQMEMLFRNLLSNALKFVPPDRYPVIQVFAEKSGAMIRVKMQDNGIGIDESKQLDIFLPFRRLHRKNEYSGTGIGLAQCRTIAGRFGGRVSVQSEIGKGALFIVELPINKEYDDG
jgi:signal transduction histidine kinase